MSTFLLLLVLLQLKADTVAYAYSQTVTCGLGREKKEKMDLNPREELALIVHLSESGLRSGSTDRSLVDMSEQIEMAL